MEKIYLHSITATNILNGPTNILTRFPKNFLMLGLLALNLMRCLIVFIMVT
jgi:uncharacterized membrane protein